MRLSDLRVDSESIEKGSWIDAIPLPNCEGLRLRVRGLWNSDYRRVYGQMVRDAKPGTQIDLTNTPGLLLETILLEWDGITDSDGKPIVYSQEMAKTIVLDPDYQPFRDAIFWAAGEVAGRRKNEQDDAAKN